MKSKHAIQKNNSKNKNDFKEEPKKNKTKSRNQSQKHNTNVKDENIDIEINSEIEQKKPKKKKHRFLKRFILFNVLTLLILSTIVITINLKIFLKLSKQMVKNEPSVVLASDGSTIAEIGGERIRENVTISEIPNNLKNAYVSIEDQRYFKHHGVDIKRTASAIFFFIKNKGSANFGGSTITQQLVKNLTGNNSASADRKIKEWFYAVSLEFAMSKDQILEAYFNIIYVGPNIYGVQSGAKYYFNKDVSELSLSECAFLAGINNAPNTYNPFTEKDRTEKITKRTKTVLNKMLELGFIDNNEFEMAVSEVEQGLNFNKGTFDTRPSMIYSYHTDALLNEIIEEFADKNFITKDFATNYFALSKSTIYSTQDNKIQKIVSDEFSKKKYIIPSAENQPATSQAAMVIIDQYTGQVLACTGGLGEKNTARGLNRATQSKRQTGSAIKPIAVLAPALDKKLITNSSIFLDQLTTFDDGTEEGYSPTNYDGYLGNITLRRAVESSQNIPFVTIMEELTPKTSISYLRKMGITTLTTDDENLNLALGGLVQGMTPLEFAAAYATIANDGIYIEPTFYTNVVSSDNKIILQTTQKKRQAFSSSTAYLVKQLLTEPVKGTKGTATYCNIPNMDVSAKTGTTNENYDRWLCGFTPYYTAVTWYGYDLNETINYNGKNPAGLIWSAVMKEIHSGLAKKTFQAPNNIVSTKICAKSRQSSNKQLQRFLY